MLDPTTYQYSFPSISTGYTMIGNLAASITPGAMLSPSDQNSYLTATQWTALINNQPLITWSGSGQLADLQLLPTEQLTVQVQSSIFVELQNFIQLQWIGTLLPSPGAGQATPFKAPLIVSTGLVGNAIPQAFEADANLSITTTGPGTLIANIVTETGITINGILLSYGGYSGSINSTCSAAVHDSIHTNNLAKVVAMFTSGATTANNTVNNCIYVPIGNYVTNGITQLVVSTTGIAGVFTATACIYYTSTTGF
jgi:hypothetical protein